MTDYIAGLQQALREAAAREYPARAPSPDPMQWLIGEEAPSEQRHHRSPLEGLVPRRRGRRQAARWLAPALALATALVVAAVVITAGGGPSIVARAYAATSTNGVIVHYIQTLQFRSSSGKSQTAVHDVWSSGQQRHLIVTGSDPSQGTEEIAFNGSEVQNYHSPGGTMYTYRVAARLLARDCGSIGILLGECGRSDQTNPLTALRRLYQSDRLHAAGQITLGGRPVDLITGSSQKVRLRALVDPHTFVPIKIQLVQQIPRPAAFPALQLTTTITDYQRLPLTRQNRRLLLMRAHPHARLLHLCVNGARCTKSRAP
jgi:hypothetical protein